MIFNPTNWSNGATYFFALVVGYLLGSIPFGVILTRLAGVGDVRGIGSGNIGATNVLRTGHRGLAALTLLGDGLKGTAAVLAATPLGGQASVIAGFAAFLGHLYPVWLKFRGGKGVATYVGVLAGLCQPAAIGFGIAWFAAAMLSRYSSVGALTATLLTPPILLLLGQWELAAVFAIMTVILWARHADNIRRLIAGTEGQIGERR